jgi:hypothetical protein
MSETVDVQTFADQILVLERGALVTILRSTDFKLDSLVLT